jgi:hypothetical protein
VELALDESWLDAALRELRPLLVELRVGSRLRRLAFVTGEQQSAREKECLVHPASLAHVPRMRTCWAHVACIAALAGVTRADAELGEVVIKIAPRSSHGEFKNWGKSGFTIDGQKVAAGETLRLPPRKKLVDVAGFLTELRAGHRYKLTPDPCCEIAFWDERPPADADNAMCAGKDGECTRKDFMQLPGFLGHGKCGERFVCVPPPLVRFRAAGPITVYSDFEEPLYTVSDGEYHRWPQSRETSPWPLVIKQGKKVLFDSYVQFRTNHHYTVVIGDKTEILVDD